MRNPELSHINKLDRERQQAGLEKNEVGDQGRQAEEVVINFLRAKFPNMEVRPATKEEDEGGPGIGSKKIIDAVAYLDKKPALGLQITTATDTVARHKKLKELQDRPFIRLGEMRPQVPAIPKIIAFVEAKEIDSFIKDPDFDRHTKLSQQILVSIMNSLKYNLFRTKNPDEIKRLQGLIEMFEQERKKIA